MNTTMKSTLAVLATGAAGFAAAQTPPAAPPASQLEEVTVSAQRRDTSLQSTPLALSAFTADQLEQRQITEASDLMRAVPNFNVNNNTGLGTANAYWLRGSGVGESIATFDPPVGTYIDEVFQPRINAAQLELLDIDRLEVLRGPQGTLFGRNTTAGALSFISRKPQDTFEGRADLGFGRFDRKSVRLSLNQPFSDTTAGRFSAYWVKSDGNMTSLTTGEDYNGVDSWGLRGALRFQPADSVDWTISATYVDASETAIGTALAVGRDPVTNGVSNAVVSGNLFRNFTDLRNCSPGGDIYAAALSGCVFNEAKNAMLVSNLEWQTGLGKLSFITGYLDTQVRNSVDYLDNHPQNPLGAFTGPHFYIIADLDLKSWSQEIKLSGTAAGDRITYVAGLYYMNEDNRSLVGDLATAAPIVITRRDLENGTDTAAAYAQADFKLGERLTATAGIRYTDEQKDIGVNYTNVLGNRTFTNAALVALGYPVELTERRWTPKFGVQYQFSDDVMAYASATTGFKSGGWNSRVNLPQNLVAFGPEKVKSYEIGVRADWLDQRLRTNLTAFRAEYEDRQIATSLPGTTAFVTTNAGDTPVDGVELELQAVPLEGLNIYATVGWMDAKLENLSANALAVGFLGPNTQVIQTPDYTLLVGANYGFEVPGLNGRLTFGADVSSKDKFYSDWANLPNQQVKQPTLVNASIRYRTSSDRWGIALDCKNCADKDWVRQNLIQVAYPGDPLQWGLNLDYRFE